MKLKVSFGDKNFILSQEFSSYEEIIAIIKQRLNLQQDIQLRTSTDLKDSANLLLELKQIQELTQKESNQLLKIFVIALDNPVQQQLEIKNMKASIEVIKEPVQNNQLKDEIVQEAISKSLQSQAQQKLESNEDQKMLMSGFEVIQDENQQKKEEKEDKEDKEEEKKIELEKVVNQAKTPKDNIPINLEKKQELSIDQKVQLKKKERYIKKQTRLLLSKELSKLKIQVQKQVEKQWEESQQENNQKISEEDEIELNQNELQYSDIACSVCNTNPILGIRYQCCVCKNVNFCFDCEKLINHEHPLLKILRPEQAPKFILVSYEDFKQEGKETKLQQFVNNFNEKKDKIYFQFIEKKNKIWSSIKKPFDNLMQSSNKAEAKFSPKYLVEPLTITPKNDSIKLTISLINSGSIDFEQYQLIVQNKNINLFTEQMKIPEFKRNKSCSLEMYYLNPQQVGIYEDTIIIYDQKNNVIYDQLLINFRIQEEEEEKYDLEYEKQGNQEAADKKDIELIQ